MAEHEASDTAALVQTCFTLNADVDEVMVHPFFFLHVSSSNHSSLPSVPLLFHLSCATHSNQSAPVHLVHNVFISCRFIHTLHLPSNHFFTTIKLETFCGFFHWKIIKKKKKRIYKGFQGQFSSSVGLQFMSVFQCF